MAGKKGVQGLISVDPLTKGFPQLTPYQFASNSPIANIDLDGGEAKYYDIILREFYDGKGMLKKTTKSTEYNKTKEAGWHLNGIIPGYTKSGRLGEGTLYSVTKVKQYEPDDNGVSRMEIATIGSIYTPPPPVPNKEHPEASGSFGIQVFGSGYDPNEAPTSRANANMHVITMNFKEFQEIVEPLFLGNSGKSPSKQEIPGFLELVEHAGEYAIDKAIEKLIEEAKTGSNSEKDRSKKTTFGYTSYKRGTILYTTTGNVRIDSDSSATCCQDDKNATDTLESLKKKKN